MRGLWKNIIRVYDWLLFETRSHLTRKLEREWPKHVDGLIEKNLNARDKATGAHLLRNMAQAGGLDTPVKDDLVRGEWTVRPTKTRFTGLWTMFVRECEARRLGTGSEDVGEDDNVVVNVWTADFWRSDEISGIVQ